MGLYPIVILMLNIISAPPTISKNIKSKTKPNKKIKTKYRAAFLYFLVITDNLNKNKFY